MPTAELLRVKSTQSVLRNLLRIFCLLLETILLGITLLETILPEIILLETHLVTRQHSSLQYYLLLLWWKWNLLPK